MTCEPVFYRELYQTKFRGDDTKIFQIFGVPIGNANITRKVQFYLAELEMKYHQKTYSSYCFSTLASAFHCINENRAVLSFLNTNLPHRNKIVRIEFILLMLLCKTEEKEKVNRT